MEQLALISDSRWKEVARVFKEDYKFGSFSWGLERKIGSWNPDWLYSDLPSEVRDEWLFRYIVAGVLCAHERLVHVEYAMALLDSRFKDFHEFARGQLEVIEHTLYRSFIQRQDVKAQWVLEIAKRFSQGFRPLTQKALLTLPGVGEHTAEVVLATCLGANYFGVDTHVTRITQRLNLSVREIREAEFSDRGHISNAFTQFGRETCTYANPRCHQCRLAHICPSRRR